MNANAGRRGLVAAGFGVVLFTAAWALLHAGFYAGFQIVDTPVYQEYGEAVVAGELPYRDFPVEYPPAAVPAFVLPALGPSDEYRALFEALMWLCGAAAVSLVAVTLVAVAPTDARLYGGVAFAALAPLALGPVVLTRYDLWPAALVAAALAALAALRPALGLGALALAAAAKVYPLVLVPPALVFLWRRCGTRTAALAAGAFLVVLAVVLAPFALVALDGLAASFERQAERPLQIESLGAAVLLAAAAAGAYEPSVVSTHGSQNLAGPLPDVLASASTVLQVAAVAAAWAMYARSGGGREGLLAASAASVAGLVAFAKVLSPQFLIWLVPLVPLVAGGWGIAAAAALAAALVLTQLWFPSRYWDLVALQPAPALLVLARDVALVALWAILLAAIRRGRGELRSA